MRNAALHSGRRDALVAAACAALGLLAFGRGGMVPVIGHVDIGVHELGQLAAARVGFGEVSSAIAGSASQVVVPVLLAAHFLLAQRDRAGGALCLAWAATAAAGVAASVAAAAEAPLSAAGGDNEWTLVLGQMDRLAEAASIASAVRGGGLVLLTASLVVCAWPAVQAAWAPAPAAGGSLGALPAAPVAPVRRIGGRGAPV